MALAERTIMLEELLFKKEIKDLETLFKVADANYVDLQDRLGIKSKNKFTRLMKSHKEYGDMETAKAIADLLDIKASVLINGMNFGFPNISMQEMDDLLFEESISIAKTA